LISVINLMDVGLKRRTRDACARVPMSRVYNILSAQGARFAAFGWDAFVMAKLSDIFGRKGELLTPRPGQGNGNGNGGHIDVDNLSDIGSRIGEENEELRSLLTDTGRKIGELDDLKQAFDKLVTPFNATLRALEQEKSQTIGLTGMLDEARSSYETLRGEFYQIERKATALEAESERLKEDLELSREQGRALESTCIELTNRDFRALGPDRRARSPIGAETSQRRTLSENRRTLQEQLDSAEKRIVELEGELAAAREKLALLDDENRSLQMAVDQGLNEVARLTRRLTESENTLTATRAQLGKVEARFADAYADRGRLGAALDEAKEAHQSERKSLNMRLDALQSRAATAERLLAEARQNLIARAFGSRRAGLPHQYREACRGAQTRLPVPRRRSPP
jgi:crescentin